MRKIVSVLAGLFLMLPAWADVNLEPLLNKVTLQLSAEQWVTTKTALVTVGINASVSDSDVGKIQSTILDKLNQLTGKAEWHIISFDRSQDQSGLEKVQVSAQARLPESALSGIRDKAKSMSKPGETFTLDNVQFTPSDDELRTANTTLRENIYQQAKVELDQLNKQYPDQKFYLHQINFMGELTPGPMPQVMAKFSNGIGAASNNLSVGDKMRITATIVLAAAPSADVVKVVHN